MSQNFLPVRYFIIFDAKVNKRFALDNALHKNSVAELILMSDQQENPNTETHSETSQTSRLEILAEHLTVLNTPRKYIFIITLYQLPSPFAISFVFFNKITVTFHAIWCVTNRHVSDKRIPSYLWKNMVWLLSFFFEVHCDITQKMKFFIEDFFIFCAVWQSKRKRKKEKDLSSLCTSFKGEYVDYRFLWAEVLCQ